MSANNFRNKLALSQIVAALLFLNLSGCAAQAWDGGGGREPIRHEIRRFHTFLQDHPRVSADLRVNPRLVGNRRYLDRHEELDDFLRRHPAVRREMLDHPDRVFGRYYLADDYGPWHR
ncbi:MAG: hypothetical protein Q8S00_20120 [Deltaproteobacteria bacterium]|nr:hypothetical protein [Deltaproteobacteria bacterium]MDZ4346368.1 hypothetical protein [Candidatus Binatia bacterium]